MAERLLKFNSVRYGWPTCFVCKKPVDKVNVSYKLAEDIEVMIVQCHGQTEIVEIPKILDLRFEMRTDGYAFQPANILPEPKSLPRAGG